MSTDYSNKAWFFCGIGGSGMLPLAFLLKARGARILGSDRARDQGRSADKFAFLEAQGFALFPQDGSGVDADCTMVASAAVEESVPDIAAARAKGARIMLRAELLSALFNAAQTRIGVAGTSGKSTVTGMIGHILSVAGRNPTIVNGAVMNNLASADAPFASARIGDPGLFVAEVDESDGSIARYRPSIAVVNNIALDHKSMEELRALFGDFARKADRCVLNLDNGETAALVGALPPEVSTAWSLKKKSADLMARDIVPAVDGIAFTAAAKGGPRAPVQLGVPGRHNVANALAALGAAMAVGVPLGEAAAALSSFRGIRRRLETIGVARGITVIDDFAHNPDKIAATLAALHEFPGRLLVLFQPHGFGPLKLMGKELIATFAKAMAAGDVLIMPEPVYYGGTADRSVTSIDIVTGVVAAGGRAECFETRAEGGARLLDLAEPGDRIVVMGARDDTLSDFARDLLAQISTP